MGQTHGREVEYVSLGERAARQQQQQQHDNNNHRVVIQRRLSPFFVGNSLDMDVSTSDDEDQVYHDDNDDNQNNINNTDTVQFDAATGSGKISESLVPRRQMARSTNNNDNNSVVSPNTFSHHNNNNNYEGGTTIINNNNNNNNYNNSFDYSKQQQSYCNDNIAAVVENDEYIIPEDSLRSENTANNDDWESFHHNNSDKDQNRNNPIFCHVRPTTITTAAAAAADAAAAKNNRNCDNANNFPDHQCHVNKQTRVYSTSLALPQHQHHSTISSSNSQSKVLTTIFEETAFHRRNRHNKISIRSTTMSTSSTPTITAGTHNHTSCTAKTTIRRRDDEEEEEENEHQQPPKKGDGVLSSPKILRSQSDRHSYPRSSSQSSFHSLRFPTRSSLHTTTNDHNNPSPNKISLFSHLSHRHNSSTFSLLLPFSQHNHHKHKHTHHYHHGCKTIINTPISTSSSSFSPLTSVIKCPNSSSWTKQRRSEIQRTWAKITQKHGKGSEPGLLIFREIFAICPQLRPLFKVEEALINLSESGSPPTITNSNFIRHTRVFTNVIDLTVRNIMDLDSEIGPILETYGRRHFTKHNRNFSLQYLGVFVQGILTFIEKEIKGTGMKSSTSSELEEREILNSWLLLCNYLVMRMKVGYESELAKSNKSSSSYSNNCR